MLDWIELHQGLTSWVQAVGSILAILAVFAIGQSQARTAARLAAGEAHARALALGILIRDDIATLGSQFGTLSGLAIDEWQDAMIDDFALPVPETVLRHVDRMYLLGTAGHEVLRMVATIYSIRAIIERTSAAVRDAYVPREDGWAEAQHAAQRGVAACLAAEAAVDVFLSGGGAA